MSHFYGIHVAIVSPMTDSFSVDYEKLHEHATWLIDEGVHGLVAGGLAASMLFSPMASVRVWSKPWRKLQRVALR